MTSIFQKLLTYVGAAAVVAALLFAGFHVYADHQQLHQLQTQTNTIGQLTELIRKTLVEELHPDHFQAQKETTE